MPNTLTLEEAWDIIQEQRKQMRLMEEQIKLLTQKRFGKSSEKSDDPGQLSIFDDCIKNNEVKDSRVFEQPETTGRTRPPR
ncbi:transposase [Lactiplantibacillus sp. WILCCON 0030]|uniref:Transposase n=1 Tax=Lactiplantibacillus brownii TaxID=3069269 RepID=A0ABU1AD43_9LACO|nr:transposase [Lactiplantibacillus brownii]MDQ7938347.1 transposase [Lactiplantibacillus brownii]